MFLKSVKILKELYKYNLDFDVDTECPKKTIGYKGIHSSRSQNGSMEW